MTSHDDVSIPRGAVQWVPVGLVVSLVGGAMIINTSISGLSNEITESRGDTKQLRAELKHSTDMLSLKMDNMGKRLKSVEDENASRDTLYLTGKDMRNMLLELQAANKDLRIPGD